MYIYIHTHTHIYISISSHYIPQNSESKVFIFYTHAVLRSSGVAFCVQISTIHTNTQISAERVKNASAYLLTGNIT
jgi:hypothetical protein